MSTRIFDLPLSGQPVSPPPPQGTEEGLAAVLQPLLDHPDTAEFGWSQTWIGVDSDPEHFDVRKIWLRTTSDADQGLSHYELRLFAAEHPTLGHALYSGALTPYKSLVTAFFDGIRYGNFRDVLLQRWGTDADVVVSKGGVVLANDYADEPEFEYANLGNGIKVSTDETVAAQNAWWMANRETSDWR